MSDRVHRRAAASAMRLVTPVDVSLCTTTTALIVCVGVVRQAGSSSSGSDAPRRQFPGT